MVKDIAIGSVEDLSSIPGPVKSDTVLYCYTLRCNNASIIRIFLTFRFFIRFRESLGVKVIKALQRDSDVVTHAAIDMIVTLLCVSYCHNKAYVNGLCIKACIVLAYANKLHSAQHYSNKIAIALLVNQW